MGPLAARTSLLLAMVLTLGSINRSCFGEAKGSKGKKRNGALGEGSENLDDEETEDAVNRYKQAFVESGGHPLLRHGKSLACSACRMTMDRFQNKVARSIKGKMLEAEKAEIFDRNIEKVCDRAGFPVQTAVVDKGGKEIYVDFQDAMSNHHGKVSIKRMSPEIVDDVVAACSHLVDDAFRDALRAKVLALPKGARGTDVDFRRWLCGPGRAAVCDEEDEDEEDGNGDSEEAEL